MKKMILTTLVFPFILLGEERSGKLKEFADLVEKDDYVSVQRGIFFARRFMKRFSEEEKLEVERTLYGLLDDKREAGKKSFKAEDVLFGPPNVSAAAVLARYAGCDSVKSFLTPEDAKNLKDWIRKERKDLTEKPKPID